MKLICRDATGVGVWALLPAPVNTPQVVSMLGEYVRTRPIPVSARVKMYLAGSRSLFELPDPGQSPQAH